LLKHGGGIREAARLYGVDPQHWLDLSTGINSVGWTPPSSIPPGVWRRLPESGDGLEQAALEYYKCSNILPASGSQAIIQVLPRLRKRGKVAVLSPGYAEHHLAWEKNGHTVLLSPSQDIESMVYNPDVGVVVIINPNNPTGETVSSEKLLVWQTVLADRGAWLVVDEAFMDSTPDKSIFHVAKNMDGLIVLRSLGKFFGLAGVRVGFVSASSDILERISEELGPWNVNGPARFVASLALLDRKWQENTRLRLLEDALRLKDLLTKAGFTPNGGTPLFQWFVSSNAPDFYKHMAHNSILVRLFDQPKSIRVGLPPDEVSWTRLEKVLSNL